MEIKSVIEASDVDLQKIERWLIYEVTEDRLNFGLCRERAKMVLDTMLNEAFHRGREFEKRLQSCVD